MADNIFFNGMYKVLLDPNAYKTFHPFANFFFWIGNWIYFDKQMHIDACIHIQIDTHMFESIQTGIINSSLAG